MDSIVDLIADICGNEKFISIHHLQAPHYVARDLAAMSAGLILENWEGATLYIGTKENEEKQVNLLIQKETKSSTQHAVNYATLTRRIETTPFDAATNLAIILEADADMSIEYAHCIIAISQKLRGLDLESSEGQGGIRLLTVSRDSFDDRLRELLSTGNTWYQRIPREEQIIRLEFPAECIIEVGGSARPT